MLCILLRLWRPEILVLFFNEFSVGPAESLENRLELAAPGPLGQPVVLYCSNIRLVVLVSV